MKELYDWLNDNVAVQSERGRWVNDPAVIRQNTKMVSVNTCLMVDFTGQVASESIDTAQYSGTGGRSDTAIGAVQGLDGRGNRSSPAAARPRATTFPPTWTTW